MASVFNRGTKDRPRWIVKYKDSDGKWKSANSYQRTKKEAEDWVHAIEARVRRGLVGIPEQKTPAIEITVGALVQRFIAEYRSPRVRNEKRRKIKTACIYRTRIAPYGLASMPAQHVRMRDIERLRDALDDEDYAAPSIAEALSLLSVAYTWAGQQDILTCRNPVSGVEQPQAEPSTDCYSIDEVHRILSLPDLSPMVAMAIHTGLRRAELSGLRWADVHMDAKRIEVQRSYGGPTKSGKPRTVPIHRDLVPILAAWRAACPASEEGLVFPRWVAGGWRMSDEKDLRIVCDLRDALVRADCRADFKRPWHALRHTFATQFIQQHGTPAALERLLGHSTSGNRVTAIYINVDFRFLADELDRLRLFPPALAQVIPIASHRRTA